VKAYHGDLERLKLKPQRALKDDMESTTQATSYAGTGATTTVAKPAAKPSQTPAATKPKFKVTFSGGAPPAQRSRPAAAVVTAPAAAVPGAGNGVPKRGDGSPDFSRMTPAQKVALSLQRIKSDIARNTDGDGRR